MTYSIVRTCTYVRITTLIHCINALRLRLRFHRVIGSNKSAHRLSRDERAAEHPSHLQNDKAVIRLSTEHQHRVETSLRAERRGQAKGLHGAMGLYQSFLPLFPRSLSLSLSCLFLSFSLSLIIAPHFFRRRRDTSQSRNPKLLNYFPIVVATDHVCSGPGSIRIDSGTYARHLAFSRIELVDPIGKYARLLSSRVSAIDNPTREILRYNLCSVDAISSVSCLFISPRRELQKERVIPLGKMGRFYVASYRYNFPRLFVPFLSSVPDCHASK